MRPTVVLLCPETSCREDELLAEGMRVIWASALIACGATPSIVDDGQSRPGAGEAIITTKLVREPGSIRIVVIADLVGRAPVVRTGRTFRGATAELRAMESTLHAIAAALWLEIPPEIGWRDLTYTKRAAEGLAHVRETGQQFLSRSGVDRAVGLATGPRDTVLH